MSNSKTIEKFSVFKSICIILMLGIAAPLSSQIWQVQVHQMSDTKLQVQIEIPIIQQDSIEIYFVGDSLLINERSSISDVAIEYENGNNRYTQYIHRFPTKLGNAYKFGSNDKRYLTYEVTFPKLSSFVPIAPIIASDQMLVFNWNNILVQFKGFEDQGMSIVYHSGTKKIAFLDKPMKEWIKNPTVSQPQFIGKVSDYPDGLLYSNVVPDYPDDFFRTVGESIFALKRFQKDSVPFQFIFIFGENTEQTGAIARNESAVFYFNKELLHPSQKFLLQKTIIHELLHLYQPKTPIIKDVDVLWQREGIAEYLALKYMLKSGLITEAVFFEKMQDKIRKGATYLDQTMGEITASAIQDPLYYDAFYTRGAIVMWLLDAYIIQLTNGEMELEDYILDTQTYQFSAENNALDDGIQELLYTYSSTVEKIPFNDFLPFWGILYEAKRLQYFYEVGEIQLEPIKNKMKIRANAGVDELLEGDVVLKANGKGSASDIENIFKNNQGGAMHLVVKRAGKKRKITVSPRKQKVKIYIESLTKMPSASPNQKLNWERYIN